MPELSKDVVALLSFLAPGFLLAWIFYALTTHAKPSQFERVVQALIFTTIIKALVAACKAGLMLAGKLYAIRPWDSDAELACGLLLAVIAGLLAAYASNNDTWYRTFRFFNLSKRSVHPNEWGGVLSRYQNYLIIHFKDERRLYGWPEVWPSDPDKGHFFIVLAQWLDSENPNEIPGTEGVLINAQDVKWIEIVRKPD